MVKPVYRSPLFLGESISRKKLDKIKKKLERHPLRSGLYLIAEAGNGVDQLEIYSAGLLAQPYYRTNPPAVIGITGSYDEALEVLERMAADCYRSRGDCSLREYLSC